MARQPADRPSLWSLEDWKIWLAWLLPSSCSMLMCFRTPFRKSQSKKGTSTYWSFRAIPRNHFTAAVMFAVYLYNTRLSRNRKSKALKAAAKDNLSDAVFRLDFHCYLGQQFQSIVDKLKLTIIIFFILKSSLWYLYQSSFSLSDGFDRLLGT